MIFNKGLIAICKEKTPTEVACTYFKRIENGVLSIRYKQDEQIYQVFNGDWKSETRTFSFYNLPAKGYEKQKDEDQSNEIRE